MSSATTLRSGLAAFLCAALAACGGGDDPVTPPSADNLPAITIVSPAEGSTYRAGDTITVNARAVDREDGPLNNNRLTWWVELHHDTHSHPARQPVIGGSGSFETPVRTETSANVWYRVHVRAIDSAGHTAEVTRDVMPRTAEVTLATEPPGLLLTLDGQPVTGPHAFTGVQGVERDLAAADQVHEGRRYRFTGWSDGGAATHTISTPTANTTYIATFRDDGRTDNTPPTVQLAAAPAGTVGTVMTITAAAADADGTINQVAFYDGGALLGIDTDAPYTWDWTPATAGTHTLTARATDNIGDSTVSAAVNVEVADVNLPDRTAPTVAITSPADHAGGLSGTVTIAATASDDVGVAGVEFQVDGVSLGNEDTSAPYEASWNTATSSQGQHILRARARDAAGNVSPWASITVQVSGSSPVPSGFTLDETWLTGLDNATAFVQAPDGRFFVAEQNGRLRVVRDGRLQSLPFATLPVDSSGERGLIGVTLHPSFPGEAWVYVHYTRSQGRPNNRVSRLLALGDIAISEDRLIDLPELSSATNHNGGAIHFGADGKLYVAVGDNARADNAPDLSVPLGKMLRLNDNGSIPNDNPYYDSQSGLARAIWASGLRNPYTFAIEPGTGRMHINDVGQETWEEINLGTAGANYGWPATEGPTTADGITSPLFAYRHGAGDFFSGEAIAGGTFYPATGGNFPASYRRNYFFADHVSGQIGRLDPANGHAAYAFSRVQGNPVDMLVGRDGALYVLTRGGIARISYAP